MAPFVCMALLFFCGAREYKISKEVVEQVDENGVPQV